MEDDIRPKMSAWLDLFGQLMKELVGQIEAETGMAYDDLGVNDSGFELTRFSEKVQWAIEYTEHLRRIIDYFFSHGAELTTIHLLVQTETRAVVLADHWLDCLARAWQSLVLMQDLSVWMVLYAGEEFRSVAPGDMIRPERADRELRHAPDREILRNAAIKLGVSRFRTAGLEILQLIVDLKFPQPRFERMTCDFSLHPSFPRT